MAKNYWGKLIFSERKEVKYPVGTFSFLEGDRLTVSLSPSSPLPTSASLDMSNGEFLAELIVELVPFPTSPSSAMSDGKFSADPVVIILSIKVSDLAYLKPWMRRQ